MSNNERPIMQFLPWYASRDTRERGVRKACVSIRASLVELVELALLWFDGPGCELKSSAGTPFARKTVGYKLSGNACLQQLLKVSAPDARSTWIIFPECIAVVPGL